MSATLTQLQDVFRDVFEDDALTVGRETTADDVPEWDSLKHVALIVNVEKAFGIRFSSLEVAGLKDVGELVDMIEAKVKPRTG